MYKKGDRVIYIPKNANGDRHHKNCEHGVVKRMDADGSGAFVIYDNVIMRMQTGDEPYPAELTRIEELVLE